MIEADKITERIVQRGKAWADREHAASLLEETRKTVRAQFASEHSEKAGSVAKAEMMAEADPRYREHVIAMVDARKEANIAKVNYDAGKIYAELVRTEQATLRAEMNLR